MKRTLTYTVSAVLVLAFLTVTTLAMVCAYHHGIDGHDQRQQGATHSAIFCPTFSKVSGLAFMITSGLDDDTFDEFITELFQSELLFYSSFVQEHLARSPPLILPS